MRKKLKIIVINMIVLIIITVSGCSNSDKSNDNKSNDNKVIQKVYVDYESYESIEELIESTDWIIEGEVIKSRVELSDNLLKLSEEEMENEEINTTEESNTGETPITIYSIEVKTVYKGEIAKEEIIEVKELGGETDTVILINEDAVNLQVGDNYVLFLKTFENNPSVLMNSIQSYYKIDGKEFNKHEDNQLDVDFEKLKKINKDK